MSDPTTIAVLGVNSPNVAKVVIMLEEIDLPYTLRHVDLFNGEQFTPEFLCLNPLGKVPVLIDEKLGQPLAESGAILLWLAERSGNLLPERTPERYEVMQWLMVQMSSIGPMLGQFTHFRIVSEEKEPYAYGRYRAQAERLYRAIDERIADREWIAGDDYSIADIATYPWARYLERHDFQADDYPALKRWRDAMEGRAPVVRAGVRMQAAFSDVTKTTIHAATPSDFDRFFGRTTAMPTVDFKTNVLGS